MKKIISLIMIAALAVSLLSSCAEKPQSDTGPAGQPPSDETTAADTPAEAYTSEDQSGTEPVSEEQTAEGPETDAPTSEEQTTAGPSPEPAADALKSFDEFDLKLMDFIERSRSGNYVISPLSFKYALGMLLAGAGGNTLKQFTDGLGLRGLSEFEDYIKSFNSFAEGFGQKVENDKREYDERIEKGANPEYLKKPGGALRVADSVWKRSDLPDFMSDYKIRLQMYDASYDTFDGVDLIKKVNDWANEKTEGLIPSILPDSYDTADIAVVLTNALYYKNGWRYEFSECGKMDFRTASGKTAEKDFIVSTERYAYYEDADTRLVVIPMDNDVNMVFVIGDVSDLNSKIAKAGKREVCVYLPEFTTQTSLDNGELISFLLSLGISDVFYPYKADLSGMIENMNDLYVSDIIQKAKIKLDQTGVEAAAVTVISVKNTAEPADPVVFRADEPFRYFIMTGESGWTDTQNVIMFEGRISE